MGIIFCFCSLCCFRMYLIVDSLTIERKILLNHIYCACRITIRLHKKAIKCISQHWPLINNSNLYCMVIAYGTNGYATCGTNVCSTHNAYYSLSISETQGMKYVELETRYGFIMFTGMNSRKGFWVSRQTNRVIQVLIKTCQKTCI